MLRIRVYLRTAEIYGEDVQDYELRRHMRCRIVCMVGGVLLKVICCISMRGIICFLTDVGLDSLPIYFRAIAFDMSTSMFVV